MRYRDYKVSAPDTHFHAFNRGNGKMDIFRDEQDYKSFLKRLKIILSKEPQGAPLRLKPFTKGEFSVLSFCLMPNHFHLQVRQNSDIPIGKLLLRVCTSYSMYFNRKYGHVGHVFQDQFKAIPLEHDTQLIALSAYIHQNPKVAGLVESLADWPYSSYLEYVGIHTEDLCDTRTVMQQFKNQHAYEAFVEERYESIKAQKELERLILDE